jgi:hypothetical protein
MSKQTKDWMEKLVENYRVPTEEETKQNNVCLIKHFFVYLYK